MSSTRLVIFGTLLAVLAAPAAAEVEPTRFRVPVDGAPSLGPPDAPVTIAVFSDFLCRYCGNLNQTLTDLRLLYGDALRVVYRHSLLDPEDGTLPAEVALAAAAQGRFWPLHDRLFAADRALDRTGLEALAAEAGVDPVRLARELGAGRWRAALGAELAIGNRLGVTSTPMMFVNGRPLAGNQPLGALTKVIDDELARVVALRGRGVAAAAVYATLTGGAPAVRGPDATRDAIVRSPELGVRHQVGLGTAAQRRGPADAAVTLVEFLDLQCGYCARAALTLDALERARPGQLRVVVRFAPLGGDAVSELAAEAALAAADQGRYREFLARALSARGLDRRALDAIAEELGLDRARFDAALADRRHRRTVLADAAEASRLGVRGTPTFFIDGEALIGAQPQGEFEKMIERAAAAARRR